ncbi:MAG: hypothetical protein ACJ72V_11045 [Nitrososphaeraceae archaeon]
MREAVTKDARTIQKAWKNELTHAKTMDLNFIPFHLLASTSQLGWPVLLLKVDGWMASRSIVINDSSLLTQDGIGGCYKGLEFFRINVNGFLQSWF